MSLTIWTCFVLFSMAALSGKSQKCFYFFLFIVLFEELRPRTGNLVTYLNVVLLSTVHNFVLIPKHYLRKWEEEGLASKLMLFNFYNFYNILHSTALYFSRRGNSKICCRGLEISNRSNAQWMLNTWLILNCTFKNAFKKTDVLFILKSKR